MSGWRQWLCLVMIAYSSIAGEQMLAAIFLAAMLIIGQISDGQENKP